MLLYSHILLIISILLGVMKSINFIMQYILDIMEFIIYNPCIIRRKKGALSEIVKNKRIKIARLECDMSQEDLAKTVGVTRQTIGLIEAGNYNPTLKLCLAICKALNKTLDDLFWEE